MTIIAAAILGIATPSRNITCFPLRRTLHCQIAQAVYRPQLQKQCATRASLDWHGFEFASNRRAVPSCSGGALAAPRYRTLAYGKTWRSGPFTCTSRVTGLTCTAGIHGLFISRQSWRGW